MAAESYREILFYASHQVDIPLHCGLLELQLPTAGSHEWLEVRNGSRGRCGVARAEAPAPRARKLTSGALPRTHPSAFAFAQGISLDDLHVTAQVFCNDLPVHEVPVSTHTPSWQRGTLPRGVLWQASLRFPIKYRDLAPNAQLVFTVWRARTASEGAPGAPGADFRSGCGGGGVPLGGCSMHLFTARGTLKTGLQKLRFFPGVEGVAQHLPGGATAGEACDRLLACDAGFRLAKCRERYESGGFRRVGWLDEVSLERVDRMMEAFAGQGPELPAHLSAEELALRRDAHLLVELPMFPCEVLYEPRVYPAGPHDQSTRLCRLAQSAFSPGDARARLHTHAPGTPFSTPKGARGPPTPDLLSPAGRRPSALRRAPSGKAAKLLGSDDDAAAFGVAAGGGGGRRRRRRGGPEEKEAGGGSRGVPLVGRALLAVVDFDDDGVNLVEEKHHRLHHDVYRGLHPDPQLKPNREEREQIERVLASPLTAGSLRRADKDLLWKFRLQLTDNHRALSRFLLAVEWDVQDEVNQVESLLEEWKRRAPIDVADALKLLGKERAFQHTVVRSFAVDRLKQAPDDELLLFLAQLVQALKYEPSGAADGGDKEGAEGEEGGSGGGGDGASAEPSSGGTLATFLVERACASLQLANFLYWYVKVEEHDAQFGDMYARVMRRFKQRLGESGAGRAIGAVLAMQDAYVGRITRCLNEARAAKGRQAQKEEQFRALLARADLGSISGGGVASLPVPIHPEVEVTGLNAEKAFMFKSAIYPAAVEFNIAAKSTAAMAVEAAAGVAEAAEGEGAGPAARRQAAAQGPEGAADGAGRGTMRVIFKSGDDLRQDQLVLQMIALMDKLLKRVNLDLKLRPYVTLATGPDDGLVEFVTNSTPVSGVLAKFNGSILAYLQHHNPDPGGPYGVTAECMNTYVKSVAGYCVVTYLLGVGDRHLDNVMMQTAGNLFHIDFGFIFGRDPKPLPPPFRFTREMADAMGGEGSEHYARFKQYLCQAYNWLRKSANLILNMLSLMRDAGIEDLRNDPEATLAKVQARFRLELTDTQAEHFILQMLNESLTSIAPQVMEVFHKISVARR